ncbi:ASCH domain-containing protein [Vibrio parahaemolyticus]|uniref:ASCH domain-containing protein n=1 Tax=Vibrio parahaemolyticus TaxID=670 RepID=UPI0005F11BC0|nr:ASCH domain-containing protein [Vibrio parahaemolyticus]EGQ9919642.1 ASCH domain-containing protein [Vibrio parahaemolyticus]EHK2884574.1 ASCH domain-containing protein [Vibrio parahaemolyticus]EJA3430375.1 ASCH domain-containing protein [Vibrio parahaemolyticus]HAS6996154.1 ASCH domain-containing protein [Vibrio parahaemolyticus]
MHVLLSIKPEFVERIFAGEKKFEYRKAIFRRSGVEKVIIYSTLPEGKVVGEFSIDKILTDTPQKIWSQTQTKSGINKEFFDDYFDGRTEAHAIKIGNVRKYINPFKLADMKEKVSAPQSFKYLSCELLPDLAFE